MPSLFAVLKSHAICGTMYRSSGTKHGTKIFEVSKVQTYCGVSKFHLVLGKDEVTSSNLVISSISLAFCRAFFVFWGEKCKKTGL